MVPFVSAKLTNMTTISGALLKAINIAWTDYSTHIKRNRKSFVDLDNIFLIPNVMESFDIKVQEELSRWLIHFTLTEQMSRRWQQAFDRKNPNMGANALTSYESTIVVRKSDFKILVRYAYG